jgi:alpha-maltose-1-phosphate synthase
VAVLANSRAPELRGEREVKPPVRVLSIQSDLIGHKTYCTNLRRCLGERPDIELTSFWHGEERSLGTKVINRLAAVRVPVVGANHSNRDRLFARVEWSWGRMSGLLAERKLREGEYDLLHFHTQVQAFGCEAIMERVPTIITIDMTSYQMAEQFTPRRPQTHLPSIRMEQRVFRSAAHILCFAEWARQSVIKDHGIPADRVSTIFPGARLQTFREPTFEAHDKPRILFVGGDFKRKGGWDLLDVFNSRFAEVAELHFVTNTQIPTPHKNVFVHSGVSAYSERWHELFQSSDFFVMPSYADALPNVFQEAGGQGLALVGTRVGGIPEMILDGENGLLIEAGDKEALARSIATLVEDRDLLMRMRRRSRAIALERFDAVSNFGRVAELFHQVAGVAKTQGK